MLSVLFFLLALQNPLIPYKPSNEFEIKLDLQFKKRNAPATSGVVVPVNERPKQPKYDGAQHAFVVLNVNMLTLSSQEVKCKVEENGSEIYNKKVKQGSSIRIQVGFIDEIKEKLRNSVYVVVLYSPDKVPVSQINITIDKDGLYLVNGEKNGKF